MSNSKKCYNMSTLNCSCKLTGHGCAKELNEHDCALYVPNVDAIPMANLNQKLAMLIRDAGAECLFVEKNDRRFTKQDLKDIENDVVKKYPILHEFIRVNPNEDAVITIFGGRLQAANIHFV